MQTKHWITLGLAAGIGILAWAGISIHDTRAGLISVHFKDTPLHDAIAVVSKKAGQPIVCNRATDTRITLDKSRAPLADVLTEISKQAGGAWSTHHAVYTTKQSLSNLVAAFESHSAPAKAGWTNVAPTFQLPEGMPGFDTPPPDLSGPGGGGGVRRIIVRQDSGPGPANHNPPGGEKGRLVGGDVDIQVNGPAPGTPRAAGSMRVITMTSDAAGNMVQDSWSPEEVLMETRLRPKLGDAKYEVPSLATATEIANLVGGKTATIYVVRSMPGGGGLPPGLMMGGAGHGGQRKIVLRSGDGPPQAGQDLPNIETMVQKDRAENYTKLTPEQRVQRAKERQNRVQTQPGNAP